MVYDFSTFPFDNPQISKGLAKLLSIFLADVTDEELASYRAEQDLEVNITASCKDSSKEYPMLAL